MTTTSALPAHIPAGAVFGIADLGPYCVDGVPVRGLPR